MKRYRAIVLSTLLGLVVLIPAHAENTAALQAALRFLTAAKQEFKAADATKNRRLKWEHQVQGSALYLVYCEELEMSPVATSDPLGFMDDCTKFRAKLDATDAETRLEIQMRANRLRMSTLNQK